MQNFLSFALNQFVESVFHSLSVIIYKRLILSRLHLAMWLHSSKFITMLKYQVYFTVLNWYFDLKNFVDYCEVLSSAVETVAEHI